MASDKVTRRGLPVHVPPSIENHTLRTRAEALAAGDTRYFTGRPCPHGHITERRVSNWKCVQCARDEFKEMIQADPQRGRDRSLAYQKRHPERTLARKQRWVEENREHVHQQRRAFRQDNAKRLLATKSKFYLENRDHILIRQALWVQENRALVYERNARWRSANPSKIKAIHHRRRARKIGAEGTHTAADILAIFDKQAGCCIGCSANLASGYDIDHVLPLSRGGSNWPENIQLLCAKCNRSKGASTMDEWAERLKARGRNHGHDASLPNNAIRVHSA